MRKEPLAKRIQWVKTKEKITYNRPFQIFETVQMNASVVSNYPYNNEDKLTITKEQW